MSSTGGLGYFIGGGEEGFEQGAFVGSFLSYMAVAIITVFWNAAIIASAYHRLTTGENPSFSYGIRQAMKCLPQIFIWGNSDKVLPLDEVRDKLTKLMPKMKLFVIEDSGHLPHMEQKQSFDAIFFDQIFGISKYEISSSNGLKIFSESKAIFLDVRTRSEHELKSIPNSLLIPVSELPYRIDELLKFKEQDIVVYCRVGNRSGVATDYLTQNGYTAMNLLGGIEAWRGPTK